MAVLLRLIAEWLWPSARLPAKERYLKLLLIAIIGVWAGPDLFAFMEMTTLLEIFGATLFMLSFAVGLRAFWLTAFDQARECLVPIEYEPLIRLYRNPSAVLAGVLLVGRRVLLVSCCAIASVSCIREFIRFLA